MADSLYLDAQWEGLGGTPHAVDDHACNLACDNVVGHTEGNLGFVVLILGGQKPQYIMIHPEEVGPMLPRVVETGSGDLGELAGSDPARWHERVDGGDEDLPITSGGIVALMGCTIVVEPLLVAVPLVRLHGKRI